MFMECQSQESISSKGLQCYFFTKKLRMLQHFYKWAVILTLSVILFNLLRKSFDSELLRRWCSFSLPLDPFSALSLSCYTSNTQNMLIFTGVTYNACIKIRDLVSQSQVSTACQRWNYSFHNLWNILV